ncbi:MAG: hypothetical protein WBM86_07675 [Waterburya sp.]
MFKITLMIATPTCTMLRDFLFPEPVKVSAAKYWKVAIAGRGNNHKRASIASRYPSNEP